MNIIAQDTLSLFYPINIYSLTKQKIKTINKSIDGKKIDAVSIIGYADYLGTDEKNKTLSENRANQVKKYFAKKNIEVKQSIGNGTSGPKLDHSNGIQKYRRVDIVFTYKSEETTSSKENLDEEIDELKVGDKLVLKNFNFIPGRHYLVVESKPELSRLINIMKANPTLKIELHGHICCETDHDDGYDKDDMNYKLSENRAKYIYQQLINNGVAADRMTYKGFGRSNPLYPLELDDAQKNANRRVEILIVEK